jgi:hypothetical protein
MRQSLSYDSECGTPEEALLAFARIKHVKLNNLCAF